MKRHRRTRRMAYRARVHELLPCLTAGCTRTRRPGYAHCEADMSRLLAASFGPQPIAFQSLDERSLDTHPPVRPTARQAPGAEAPPAAAGGTA